MLTAAEINSELDFLKKRLKSICNAAVELAERDQWTAGWREGLFDAAIAAVEGAKL